MVLIKTCFGQLSGRCPSDNTFCAACPRARTEILTEQTAVVAVMMETLETNMLAIVFVAVVVVARVAVIII